MTGKTNQDITSRKIDCDVHCTVPALPVLYPYLADHWRDYLVERGINSLEPNYYPRGHPFSGKPGLQSDSEDPPGSALDSLRQHVLDTQGARYAILNCLYGIQQIHNQDWAAAMARALNTWQAEHWLAADPRLRASIVIPTQTTSTAVDEIEHWASHPGFVQALLPVRSSTPYGKRHYWPIYAVAERNHLPIAIHTGGLTENPITPVGWPSYYIEDYAASAQAFQTQLVSLVCEGVFSKFPALTVVLLESGVTWLPALMWRLDKNWKGLRREIPWVDQLPSELVRKHFRLTIQPFDGPLDSHSVQRNVEHLGDENMLMFASDYPHQHARGPIESCLGSLSPDMQRKVLYDNGAAVYRLN